MKKVELYESQWNPVNVGFRRGDSGEPYKISTTHVSSSWYQKSLDQSGIRRVRLQHFFDMDKTVEISKALDILAEDISSENADNECAIEMKFDEHKKFLKSTVKLIEGAKDLWLQRTGFDRHLFERVRETLKYGATFYKKNHDGTLRKIPAERIVGYICDEHDDNLITHYIEDPNVVLMDDFFSNRRSQTYGTSTKNQDFKTHPIDSLLILKVGEGPYGKSILETVFKDWKRLVLIEDAIVIYRVTRAAEKRVYYIDTGNLSGPRRQQAIEQQRLRLMQKQTTRKTSMDGGIDSEYDPHSTVEDIFIPTNSQGKGSRVEVLPGGCLAMDTLVSMLDGRELSIRAIESEMKEGKELWTYSVNPDDGSVVPGLISWAGVTQKSAEVMKITLDNGEEVICTPDHKFPVYDKGFVRADELEVDESMMPLYRDKAPISKTYTAEYERIFDNKDKEWKFTHRMVADSLRDSVVKEWVYSEVVENEPFNVRHHKNHDRLDNSPINLCMMQWKDHAAYHSDYGFSSDTQTKGTVAARAKLMEMKNNDPVAYEALCSGISERSKKWWNSLSCEEREAWNQKTTAARRNFFAELSVEEKERLDSISIKNLEGANDILVDRLANDEDYNNWFRGQIKNGWTDELRDKHGQTSSKNMKKLWEEDGDALREKHQLRQKISFSDEMFKALCSFTKGKSSHACTIADCCEYMNEHFLEEFIILNSEKSVPNFDISEGFTKQSIRTLVKYNGYDTWMAFRKNGRLQNHRIVKIERLEDKIEVGTLTIDGDEKYHDYHTFALSAGIFTKNSSTGETRDLDYFVRKLASGLRIPNSMIDTQGEEQNSGQYSDMRVGTIYAVEMRYLGHVKRIARVFAYELSKSFCDFALKRNVVIPEGISIQINDPNSFAKYKEMEVAQQSLNLIASTTQIASLSKKYVLERFMFMDEEELIKNEEMKLIEMGISIEKIKNMPEEDIQNMVYGNASVAEKYGIAPPEQEPGFGGF